MADRGEAEAKLTQDSLVQDENERVLDEDDPQIKAAITIHKRHSRELMRIPEVVGTATGLSEEGALAVLVFAKKRMPPGILSERLEGLPVVVKITGEIFPMRRSRRPRNPPQHQSQYRHFPSAGADRRFNRQRE